MKQRVMIKHQRGRRGGGVCQGRGRRLRRHGGLKKAWTFAKVSSRDWCISWPLESSREQRFRYFALFREGIVVNYRGVILFNHRTLKRNSIFSPDNFNYSRSSLSAPTEMHPLKWVKQTVRVSQCLNPQGSYELVLRWILDVGFVVLQIKTCLFGG